MRTLRLWTGLVLFAFLVSHLANHALGLVSIATADAAREVHAAVWRSTPGVVLLIAAVSVHMAIALWQLYQRRTLTLSRWQWAQNGLGFALPIFLMAHVAATLIAADDLGVTPTYVVVVHWFVVHDRVGFALTGILLVVAWAHACVGVHFWLRIQPRYPRWRPYLSSLALVLPVCALAGVWMCARELALTMQDAPRWSAMSEGLVFHPPAEAAALIGGVARYTALSLVGLFGLIVAARFARQRWSRRGGMFTVLYDTGHKVNARPGTTILEASRLAGVPHAAVCGGRGRCSTCRVRVHDPSSKMGAASLDEQRVLDRVGAPANVRLACQARPSGDVLVSPIVPTTVRADRSLHPPAMQGQEMEIAILFADIRGFTNLSERKLPFDLVYILNRYCATMGEAIEAAGGRVDKFIGDGVMALFGVEGGADAGCKQALHAAQLMANRLVDLNLVLAHDLQEPLRIGIGIHTGSAIVGEIGYGHSSSITAIGDAVNTASRLESMTKELSCQLAISQEVAVRAGLDVGSFPAQLVTVRGRDEALTVYAIPSARDLAR